MQALLIAFVLALFANITGVAIAKYVKLRSRRKERVIKLTQNDLERYARTVTESGIVKTLLKQDNALYIGVNYNNIPYYTEIEIRCSQTQRKIYSFKCYTPYSTSIISDNMKSLVTRVNTCIASAETL